MLFYREATGGSVAGSDDVIIGAHVSTKKKERKDELAGCHRERTLMDRPIDVSILERAQAVAKGVFSHMPFRRAAYLHLTDRRSCESLSHRPRRDARSPVGLVVARRQQHARHRQHRRRGRYVDASRGYCSVVSDVWHVIVRYGSSWCS